MLEFFIRVAPLKKSLHVNLNNFGKTNFICIFAYKLIKMRKYPDLNNKYDVRDLELLKVQEWQLEALKMNPDYPHWGNDEEYMWKNGDSGWDRPIEIEGISNLFTLDDYNELVHFYFFLSRKNHQCPSCEGSNYNKETHQLSEDWYDFKGTGRRWDKKLTEVEIEALVKGGRLSDLMDSWYRFDEETNTWMSLDQTVEYSKREWVPCEAPVMPTPDQVNIWASNGLGHDAINKMICVKARAKHLGIYGHCDLCEDGYVYDEPAGKLGLQMWILHPRKGASRGVRLSEIKELELPQIVEYLKSAAARNADRFSRLV